MNCCILYSTEYHSSRQNIIFLFLKYLVGFTYRSEAWLNLFWEYINGKLFAVQEETHLGIFGLVGLEERLAGCLLGARGARLLARLLSVRLQAKKG
jgi:hypothetical protein